MKRFLTVSAALSLSFAPVARAQDIPSEYQQVLTALGKQGDFKANVLKVNIPRNDLSVTVANVKTPTPFGFGGWIAMTKGTGMDVMMGDLVLLQDEVNPVMSALLDNGLEATVLLANCRSRRKDAVTAVIWPGPHPYCRQVSVRNAASTTFAGDLIVAAHQGQGDAWRSISRHLARYGLGRSRRCTQSCRDRRLIEPTTVGLPAILTDTSPCAVLACARFRRQPAQSRVRAMTVKVALEIKELQLQISGSRTACGRDIRG